MCLEIMYNAYMEDFFEVFKGCGNYLVMQARIPMLLQFFRFSALKAYKGFLADISEDALH